MAVKELDPANFEPTIEQDGVVLLDCWAPWCGPCQMFAPVFEQTSEKHPDHVFAKLNTEDHQQLAQALQIQSIPTLMIFRDGILLFRQAGALPDAALEQLITQVEGLDMDDVRRQISEQEKQQEAGQAGEESGA